MALEVYPDKKTYRVILDDGTKHFTDAENMDAAQGWAKTEFPDKTVMAVYEEQEPVFVLRAQDASAAQCILHWISLNALTASPEKLKRAYQKFEEFQRFDPDRKKQAD